FGGLFTWWTPHEGIFLVPSLYLVGTPMLTGHGRRLPGWPRDLGMDWARTPAPFFSVPTPARLALVEEGAESFLGLFLNAQPRQPPGRFHGCSRAVPGGRMGHIAYQYLGLRQSTRCSLQERFGNACAARVEQAVGHDFMHQPQFLERRRAQRLGGQKVAPRGPFADLAQHEGGNDRGYDSEPDLRECEPC